MNIEEEELIQISEIYWQLKKVLLNLEKNHHSKPILWFQV